AYEITRCWSSDVCSSDLVPYSPAGPTRPTDAFRRMGGDEEFYILYFQQPGRAEAEIEEDVRSWLLGMYVAASGDAVGTPDGRTRSEERRVGKEGRSRWAP